MTEGLPEHPLRDRQPRPTSGLPADLWLPIASAIIGAVLLFAGYWGASDTTDPGEQLPHLASGTIPGAVLVIVAAVLAHRREMARARQEAAAVAARLDALVDWLAADAEGTANGTANPSGTPAVGEPAVGEPVHETQ